MTPHVQSCSARIQIAYVAALLLGCSLKFQAAEPPQVLDSAWPQPYSVHEDRSRGVISLSTPYYTIQHGPKHGGTISLIHLTHGAATNLLVRPFETRIEDEAGNTCSDSADGAPRIRIRQTGFNPIIVVESTLRGQQSRGRGITAKTTYEYRWGYVKVHQEFTFPKAYKLKEICPMTVAVAPSLTAYGYRDGITEQEGAPSFSFGSCHWGNLGKGSASMPAAFVPRYVMLADPGVEGLEWFVSSDLSQWDLQLTGKRGQASSVLAKEADGSAVKLSIAPFQDAQTAITVPTHLVFDYYIGLPLLEGHAFRPWFHSSFNRNRGEWVRTEQIHNLADSGIQTIHCHNDGDYYDDGLFWRDGSYPPYPDMERYDRVITDCQQAGIRVGTYFSNKELHPSTPEFKQHGIDWGRMNRKGELQHNFFKGKSEFGAQMCLRSGWLDYLKASIDRVLTNNRLDGVYYDWNVALLCCNPRHERLQAGEPGRGHWDIDELLNLMEWTRRRVGPRGLVIVHNTTTPMFATENFADYVAANEWGYGKWSGKGPTLEQLPLEWSLVGARPRGVISYGQLDAQAPKRLHRVFALEALVAGVTPWPTSPEAFEIYPLLKPIGNFETCRFADWRNHAVTLGAERASAAVYSRPNESWLVIANLDSEARDINCVVNPLKLPYALTSIRKATLYPEKGAADGEANQPRELEAGQLTTSGIKLPLPADSAILVRVQ